MKYLHGNLEVYGSAGQWSGHYEATNDQHMRRLKACPHCGLTIGLEICNTHTPSYWIECECGSAYHGDYIYPGRKASKAKVVEAHQKSLDSAIAGWNRRKDSP